MGEKSIYLSEKLEKEKHYSYIVSSELACLVHTLGNNVLWSCSLFCKFVTKNLNLSNISLRTLCYLKNIACTCMYFSYTCMFSYLNVIGSKDVLLVFNTTWVQKIAKKTKEKA